MGERTITCHPTLSEDWYVLEVVAAGYTLRLDPECPPGFIYTVPPYSPRKRYRARPS